MTFDKEFKRINEDRRLFDNSSARAKLGVLFEAGHPYIKERQSRGKDIPDEDTNIIYALVKYRQEERDNGKN